MRSTKTSPNPTVQGALRLSLCIFAVLTLLLGCSRRQKVETIRLADGNVTLYVEEDVYTFRRNNWSFFAWIHSGAMKGDRPRVLIHLDSHSDMHPAPVCKNPDGLIAGNLDVAETYTQRLSISSFMFPAQHYGFVEEVFWVQPPISSYRGPAESVSFSLEEMDGWIRPKPKEKATPLNTSRWTVRSFRAEEVPRSLDVAVGAGYGTENWAPGPVKLHCLSLDQLLEKIAGGDLDGKDILLDLDVDYFGTSGPMRGYGYLTVGRTGHVALGVLGRTFPLFFATRESQIREMRRVAEMIRDLSPRVVTISESPDHAHREDLPFLMDLIREELMGRGGMLPSVQSVRLRNGAESTPLSPKCATYVDLGGADSVAFVVSRDGEGQSPLEASLYFNPLGSDDRVILRTLLSGGDSVLVLPVPADSLRESWLGPGWEIEVRSAEDGGLVWTAGFCLDDGLLSLRNVLQDLADRGLPVLRDPLSYASMAPSDIITEGRSVGLGREHLHRILLAHPRIFFHQCQNLENFRRRSGTIALVSQAS
jgi:hypothetical protein